MIRSLNIMNGLNIVCMLLSLEIVLATEPNTNSFAEKESPTRILSRRKRFLIFPDGSSFQLVFCAQNQGYLQIGDIVWFGNTAALAWELPSDPDSLLMADKFPFSSVFCAQNQGYLQIGDIVWFGNTAALAWELPSDPDLLLKADKFPFSSVFCAQNQGYLQVGGIVWFGNPAALAWELPSDPDLLLKADKFPFSSVFCAQNQGYLQIGDIVWLGNTAAIAWELPSDPDLLLKADKFPFSSVFCAQNQGYLQVGDIVWFGNTAALAWELPSDPDLLLKADKFPFSSVFCVQNQGYLQVGDIVWFGNTAALAWELPSDPDLLLKLKKHDKLFTAQNRDGVYKLLYYLDAKGNVLSKVPYRKRPIVNPAFAKRSLDGRLAETEEFNATVRELHTKQKNMRIFDDLDDASINFHRAGRQSLYEHLETFMKALGWTGKECVLRLLCESGKGSADQGTFLEEIFRATFTLPKSRKFVGDLYRDYDEAHRAKGDCNNLYPRCRQTVK